MRHEYYLRGVCPTKLEFDLNGDVVTNIVFTGGCNGNLKAIGKLVEGKSAEEIRDLLAGNTCGFNSTSCADQLSRALAEAMEKEAN